METIKQQSKPRPNGLPNTLIGHAIRPLNSPHNLALGIALGVLVGLVPKFSILPWLIGVVALLLPMNLLAFFATAIALTFLSPLLDVQFHQFGYALLTEAWSQEFWSSISASRFFVWSQMNNTVVTGAVASAILIMIPVYFFAHIASRILAPIVTRVLRHRVSRWLIKSPEFVH